MLLWYIVFFYTLFTCHIQLTCAHEGKQNFLAAPLISLFLQNLDLKNKGLVLFIGTVYNLRDIRQSCRKQKY